MNIILLGFKASGKSTLGRALAQTLGRDFLDTDTLAEEIHAARHPGETLTCRAISRAYGLERLRELEAEAARRLRDEARKAVIATGGGIVLGAETMRALSNLGPRVFLDAPLPLLEQRLRTADSPLFAEKSVAELYRERRPLYLRYATLLFPVEKDTDPLLLAARLAEKLGETLNYFSEGALPPDPRKGPEAP